MTWFQRRRAAGVNEMAEQVAAAVATMTSKHPTLVKYFDEQREAEGFGHELLEAAQRTEHLATTALTAVVYRGRMLDTERLLAGTKEAYRVSVGEATARVHQVADYEMFAADPYSRWVIKQPGAAQAVVGVAVEQFR